MSTIFKKKKELYNEWSKLKQLGENKDLTYDQFYKIRNKEQVAYEKWKFLDGFSKAKEKIENEKKKN